MKKDDTKLRKLVAQLLELLASDAYASGEGFEFMMVEEDIGACLERLPIPEHLKQVRGAIYQSKGKDEIKKNALWLVTSRASLSPRLSEEVALYILKCADDSRIGENLQHRAEFSDRVRDEAARLADHQFSP